MAKRKKVIENLKPWYYQGLELDHIVPAKDELYKKYEGFIYRITNLLENKIYIGKKSFRSWHTEITHALNEKTGRMNKVKNKTFVESRWQDYCGSNPVLLQDIKEKGAENFQREILYFVKTKKLLTYYEAKEQMILGVIEPGLRTYNDNILGKFYTKDFVE